MSFIFAISFHVVFCFNCSFLLLFLWALALSYPKSLLVLMVDIPLQLWNNLRYAYGDQPDLVELVETLSRNFERLYENEVCAFLFSLLSISLYNFNVFIIWQ